MAEPVAVTIPYHQVPHLEFPDVTVSVVLGAWVQVVTPPPDKEVGRTLVVDEEASRTWTTSRSPSVVGDTDSVVIPVPRARQLLALVMALVGLAVDTLIDC